MIVYREFGSGICADVTFGNDGHVYVALQQINPKQICVRRDNGALWEAFPMVPVSHDQCFPTFVDRQDAIAYRVGGHGTLWMLTNDGGMTVPLGPCGGIFPFAGSLARQFIGFRGAGGETRILNYPSLILERSEYRQSSQGLASVTDLGVPIYREDTRRDEQPYGTYPDYAGPYVVTEGRTSGALVRDTRTGKSVSLWSGQDAKTPAIAVHPDGTQIAVVTVAPLRLAVFTPDDLTDALPLPDSTVPDFHGRKIWAGIYKQAATESGGELYPPWHDLPGNCWPCGEPGHGFYCGKIDTEQNPMAIGIYCEAQGPAWYLGLHQQHVEAKAKYPRYLTFGVIDANVQEPMLLDSRLPDVPVYEAYLRGDESVSSMIARLRYVVEHDAHIVCGLVPQMYRGPGSATPEELARCVVETIQIAYDFPKVRCVWGFAANRANGLRDPDVYAAVMPHWEAFCRTVTVPPIVRV